MTPTRPTFCEKLVCGKVLKMPPIKVPRPSVRSPAASSVWVIGRSVMSDSARNMPVDSIITTIITSVIVIVSTITGSKVGRPKTNGVTMSNHCARATLSRPILPRPTASTQPATMRVSTGTLARKTFE